MERAPNGKLLTNVFATFGHSTQGRLSTGLAAAHKSAGRLIAHFRDTWPVRFKVPKSRKRHRATSARASSASIQHDLSRNPGGNAGTRLAIPSEPASSSPRRLGGNAESPGPLLNDSAGTRHSRVPRTSSEGDRGFRRGSTHPGMPSSHRHYAAAPGRCQKA